MTTEQTATSEGTPPRIAVVDDDAGIRRALARLLRTEGYQVRTFCSAAEFLASCPRAEIDCLILDVYLGGITGLDLYARMTAEGPVPPTIFITAYEEELATGPPSSAGSAACLRKPFEEDSLLSAIDQSLRRSRL
jgi:FixJ family two-component response regulator